MKSWLVSGLMLLSAASFAQGKLKKASVKPDTTIYTSVEEPPEFPGGLEKMGAYLAKTEIAGLDSSNYMPGRVIIQMIVEKDGSLTQIKAVRGNNNVMERAYIKRMQLSPKWQPGLLHGKPVRVRYSLPITVCISSNE